ncbi:MAG: c-type cytochrome [Chitinophagales bacterium]
MKNNVVWVFFASTLFLILQFSIGCGNEPRDVGQMHYELYCANCHKNNGEGLANLIPPLANSDYLLEHVEELPCMIYYGMNHEIEVNGRTFNQPMPANAELSSQQIMLIANYILNQWGNEHRKIFRQEIEQWFGECEQGK